MTITNSTNNSAKVNKLEKQILDLQKQIQSIKIDISNNSQSISNNHNDISSLKFLDSRWNQSIEGSYDPQLPYYIHRKNEKFNYIVKSFKVTEDEINSLLNDYGENGWFIVSMSSVEESSGLSTLTFKKLENSNVKFNYTLFKYEKDANKKFQKILEDSNQNGYDLITTTIFNKSASFCLMAKTIY